MINIMINIIVCFFIIILLMLMLIYQIKENFYIFNNKYSDYNLGDLLKGYSYKHSRKTFMFLINKYPKSIASKYYNSVKNFPKDKKWSNTKIISEIVNEISSEKPSGEIIVIHLRLGDAILNYKNDKFIFLRNSNGIQYGTPIYKLEMFLKKNKKKKYY